jgi:hypothetical protein
VNRKQAVKKLTSQKLKSSLYRKSTAVYSGTVAFGCLVLALAISWDYPSIHSYALWLVALVVLLSYLNPTQWISITPAFLPIIGFAPWTGWLIFEELDVIVLAVAAGGYVRLAFNKLATERHRIPFLSWSLITLFVVSTGLAMTRGFVDAGGFSFGWFQGFHEPMNSVRIGKSFVLALIMLPMWRASYRSNPHRSSGLLSLGIMLGLAGASLATVWERAAFPGLLDFSSDYRTTALFWEMNVGGAALDGFLALTVPFALRELIVARSRARLGLAATVLVVAAYACLTTFSRGVYLAVPVGVGVLFLLERVNGLPRLVRNVDDSSLRGQRPWQGMLSGLFLVSGFAAGAAWMFQSSGYRGMTALLTATALMLPLARVMRGFKPAQWVMGAVFGVAMALMAMGLDWVLPKGAYVAWGLATALTLAALIATRRSPNLSLRAGPFALAGFVATLTGVALVANHWGDEIGLMHAAPILLTVLVLALVAGARRAPVWPDALRWQMSVAGAMALAAVVVGVFGGGAYMGGRFSTSEQDLGGRLAHWRLGRDMLQTSEEWWLGKGLGRFPASYFMLGKPQERTGDYRIKQEGENTYLTLSGGLHINGWGEIFRVSQRVSEPGKAPVVSAQVRTAKDVGLHFEVCEKHLLYGQNCLTKQVGMKGKPGVWQDLRVGLEGDGASRGAWYAPRLLMFSMAMESRGGVADIDNVSLTTAAGQQLLDNGSFGDDMARWFFTSDKHHMPWHIKSMPMNVLFEQGMVGLAIWGALLVGALWRVSLGSARSNSLAPALAAGLISFMVVGLFDSLLDVPRLAWLFYLLLLIALTLPARQSGSPRPAASR